MSPIAKENVEILIHTTAPSLGVDDARYRSLAQAYLDFRPAKRQRVDNYRIGGGIDNLNTRSDSHQHGNRQDYNREERDSEASWRPDDDGHESISQQRSLNDLDRLDITELLNSPELSFLSVIDNRASPAFRAPVTWGHGSSQKSAEGSWQPPGSEVPDSQPEINPTLAAFSSPMRILEVFLQNRDSPSLSGPSSESHRYPDSLGRAVNSQKELASSPVSHSQNPDQDNSSLEVQISSEEYSSSQSLPHHRNEVIGSPDLGANSVDLVTSTHPANSAEALRENGSVEIEFGSKKLSSQSFQSSQNGTENSLQFSVTKQSALQSSQIIVSNSSPSPVKTHTKNQDWVLRSKSPNKPIIHDQLGKKRKFLGTISETQPSSSAPPALALNELPTVPRPTKHQQLEHASSPIKAVAGTPTSSNLSTLSGTRPRTTVWTDRLEIHPPPPQTSMSELKAEMLISPRLHDMTTKWPLENYFLPKKEQIRDLRPMERGYWLIDCSTWAEEVRSGCWNFLGELIGQGRAGWGVWCVRDTPLESFRVYCWGIVVGHLYLVLRAASLNKIIKSGACWIAGDGKVIIKMHL